MRSFAALAATMLLIAWGLGCSGSDSPTDPGDENQQSFVDTSVQNSSTGVWTTTIDASSFTDAKFFSFGDGSIAGAPKLSMSGSWDISFLRTNINLNGGVSADGGNVRGAVLGMDKMYNDVTIADTAGVSWISDELQPVIDQWFTYDMVFHQFNMTRFVYTMIDAEGDNYIKFRIDSLSGTLTQASMGVVHLTYSYQPMANSTVLNGSIQTASITVGPNIGYFDFSSGSQVTPSSPSASLEWDLMFYNFSILQNSGPNGTGKCGAFQAFTTLTDSTDLAELTAHPAMAPLFPDFISSVFAGSLTDEEALWYNYNHVTNILTSKGQVYLIEVGTAIYKMELLSYYADIGGTPKSAHYSFIWKQL